MKQHEYLCGLEAEYKELKQQLKLASKQPKSNKQKQDAHLVKKIRTTSCSPTNGNSQPKTQAYKHVQTQSVMTYRSSQIT